MLKSIKQKMLINKVCKQYQATLPNNNTNKEYGNVQNQLFLVFIKNLIKIEKCRKDRKSNFET